MTQLRQAQIVVPAAELVPESPLPPLGSVDGGITMPCPRRHGDASVSRVSAVVLENDRIAATVLTGLGGGLHSLLHKASGRELPFERLPFEPVSRGPVYAATVDGPGGDPVLRLWEWDRARDLPYQIDFWLPARSDVLKVGTRLWRSDPVPSWWTFADAEPVESLSTGSGWGTLELRRTSTVLPATPFSFLGFEQQPWLRLLDGEMPATDPKRVPGRSLVSAPWRAMLEWAPENWLTAYHLGTARWHTRDCEGAIKAWRRSIELTVSPWAIRNLAVAEYQRGHVVEAVELITAAAWSTPEVPELCEEARGLLIVAGQRAEADALLRVQTRGIS